MAMVPGTTGTVQAMSRHQQLWLAAVGVAGEEVAGAEPGSGRQRAGQHPVLAYSDAPGSVGAVRDIAFFAIARPGLTIQTTLFFGPKFRTPSQ